jgi:tetratricopeptide (TPR) repeat protein
MGYASPEGGYLFNTNLAMHRAEAVHKHLDASNLSPDIDITTEDAPIDWQELKQWLAESTIDHSHDIVAIIDNTDIQPANKNKVIRERYPIVYEFMLNNWYPKLRKTAITIDFKPMSIDKAKAQLNTNPKSLSLEDMYMVALTYQKGSKEFCDIILLAADTYPDSWQARINAANVAMDKGDYQKAEQYLSGIPANNPQAMNSRGILAMSQGKYQEAMQLFQNAEKAGVSEAAYNISLLNKLIAADR